MSSGIRLLLLTVLAALTQLPGTSPATTAGVLAGLLVVVALAHQLRLIQPVPAVGVHVHGAAIEDLHPIRRQAVVAGPGRPQPRAPGARSCATS